MRKISAVVCLLLSLHVYGQQETITLQWQNNDTLLYFKEAIYIEPTTEIPKYTDLIQWPYKNSIPEISLNITVTEKLENEHIHLLNVHQLESKPVLEYQLVFEKKKPMVQVTVTPLYLNKSTGEIEKVVSFQLSIKQDKPISSLKSLKQGRYVSNSVLANNNWYKISVQNSGLHKLTYETLLEIGLENPAQTRIFGAGAILLPEDFNKGSYDDLREVPVYMYKGSDQLFGPGDYILFYARGIVTWKYDMGDGFYEHVLHPHSNHGYYFLTDDLGNPSVPGKIENVSEDPDVVVTSYDILHYHEDEKYNLLKSGKEWYGDKYSMTLSEAYPFSLKNLVFSEPLKIKVAAALRSNTESSILVKANNTTLGTFSANPVNLSYYASTYAIENSGIFEYNPSRNTQTIQVEYLQPNSNSKAWLNHIILNGRAALEMTGEEFLFRDSRSVKFGNISEFQLKNVTEYMILWDVTDPNMPFSVPYTISGSQAIFKVRTDSLRQFLAFYPDGNFPVPEYDGHGLGKIENQNLHGTDPPEMLIIYPSEFKEQALRLAEHRKEHDQFDVLMVTQEMIFNEFSSGTPDVSAIRNYLKMYYDQSDPGKMTKYLLLFGDGSYDNRDTGSYNPNLIMTYQSDNSLVPTSSFVSDDFFGLLDAGEKLYDGLLDIGIGRLPVSTLEEATLMVDKIIEYDQPESQGEWRNYICLIGDDEDGNIHMKQANNLANYIESNYPGYNVNKILLDAYPQQTTPTGDRYPDVTRAINDQISRGALIINYTGHGGVTGLAHEKILDVNNIKAWNNRGKYPLFMTATCEFSRYDEYNATKKAEVSSAGEEVLLNPQGGSIALFTTTRLVYSAPNQVLNEKFYEIVFKKDENGDCYRLGDIIVYSKNNAGPGVNKRNFSLLGDPSTTLAFPRNFVVTDSINNQPAEALNDTISALDFVTISGHITDPSGIPMEAFNGNVIPVVYDKKTNLQTLTNDGGTPMEFSIRNSILYKGNASVQNGKFNFSFYVPKDIGYNIGKGKISYYSSDGNTDAHGSTLDLIIGGLGDINELDTVGPSIELFINDTLFRNGGIVNNSPELLAYIEDPYGINTTGNGIGHDLTATLNNDRLNAINLNAYYLSDRDSFSSGKVRYPYRDLPTGEHTIEVKVWDIFNNSSSESIDFIVVESAQMLLEEVYNYPNPFIDQTWFNIEHNRPDKELEVIIKIYDIRGNLVSILQNNIYSGGYRLEPPTWQGNSMSGSRLSGGIYVYSVLVRSEDGEEAVGSGRLIIKR
ncbi:MAG: type IX secretion system sortase PorU [Bacteroidales bacterium]|nr:type IX secretion system sortase PorU [Bacteroidales bacterium]